METRKKKPIRVKHVDDQMLKDELENITNDNIELHRELTLLENDHKESEKRERQLIRKVESIKEDISLLKAEKLNEEMNLKATVRKLRMELRELEEGPNQKYQRHSAREKRPKMKIGRRHYSQGQIPMMYETGRPMNNSRNPRRRGSLKIERRLGSARSPRSVSVGGPHTKNRKMSSPCLPISSTKTSNQDVNIVMISKDKVEAAADAFTSFLRSLSTDKLDNLWKSSLDAEEKQAEQVVLEAKNLPSLLHSLVVYAFKQDNPTMPDPSVNRTKPLVSLLQMRLKPHLSERFITVEDFRNIPRWLESGETLRELEPPPVRGAVHTSDDDLRKNLKVGSICLVWSLGGQRWCEAEVVGTKRNTQGEWLVVRYCDRSKWLEKEVQRYSRLVRIIKTMN